MNPFAERAMIKDPTAFVGRRAELHDLYNRLARLQSCSVVGPRRIGKSSFLCYSTLPSTYCPPSEQRTDTTLGLKMDGLSKLRESIIRCFDAEELRTLCSDLDVDYDALRGEGKEAKARELVAYLDRRGRRSELIETCARQRPNVSWRETLEGDRKTVASLQSSVPESPYLPEPDRYVFALVDLQELANLGPDDFFCTVIERLGRAGRGRLNIDLERDGNLAGFRRFLSRTNDAGLRLVVCCDEFEMLSRNLKFGPDFFTYLRGLCSNYALALVTSSRASLYDLCHQGDLQTSQFWNIFAELTLGLMPESEAQSLIRGPFAREGIAITEEEVSFVMDLAGCHPFFLQIACYHLFEARSTESRPGLSTVRDSFLDEAHRYYAYAWDQLSEAERTALMAALRTEKFDDPAVFQQLKRNALITGSLESSSLISAGWRRFVEGKVPKAASKTLVRPNVPVVKKDIVYADFDLKVELIDPALCRVSVLQSPAGQETVTCPLPFDLEQLGEMMIDLGQQISRGTQSHSSGLTTPVAMGGKLFQTLFSGAAGQLFFESLGEVQSRGQGLRIRIHVDPEQSPHLANLPWEYLYNDRRRRFLSLNRLTPVIRYLDVQAPTTQPVISLPLRVLVAIASPNGLPPLDLDRERASIQAAWGNRSDVWVEFLDAATPSALQARLWDWQPHVLHFMGHGYFDDVTGAGALQFVDEGNRPKPVTGSQLGVLLSNNPSIQLAFLNACQSAEMTHLHGRDPFSGVATALVVAGLPAVVAMQFPISDRAALTFANKFYPRVASGEPVEVAVAFGREAIQLDVADSHEWGTPVLFMRVPNGCLFRTG